MNSIILTGLCAFWHAFVRIFTESGIYKLFLRIYSAVSGMWKHSVIMNFLKNSERDGMEKNGLLYKLTRLPFTLCEFLSKHIGAFIKQMTEESIFIGMARGYMHGALALNTRVIGITIICAVAAAEAVVREFSVLMSVAAVLGILFVLVDFNITDFAAQSKVVTFCLNAAGFNVKWDFYDKSEVKAKRTLICAVLVGLAAGAVSAVSPILGLALPVGFAGMCTVLAYPIVGVFGAVLAAPFVPTILLAGLCMLTFCALAVKALTAENFKWNFGAPGMMLGSFLVFMLVASLFSFAPVKSVQVWGMYLILAGFYFVIINTVKTKEQLYNILKTFALAGAIVSLYGVLQYLLGWNTSNAWIDEEMFEQATMRAYSTMENPNVLGEYLLLLIPVSAVFMIKAPAKKLEKWVYAGIFLLSALCMVFTQSRGCWLGLILAAMIFVTFYNGKLWGLLPLVLVILPFVMPETIVERMMSIGNTEDSSTSYRVFIWLGTLEMMKDFWLGGIGMGEGAFRSVYPLYSYNAIIAPHSHNTFLQLLTEGGIGALVIFLAFETVVLRRLYKSFKKGRKNSCERLTALAVGSGICGFLLQSMFDYTFYNYRMMAMFFVITALGMSLSYVKEGAHD